MNVRFFDRQHSENINNGLLIDRSEDLLNVLNSLMSTTPFFCELIGDNGFNLLLGIGTKGCAQYSQCDGSPPYFMAIGSDKESAEYTEYLMGDTPTPVSDRYALPLTSVRFIASEFQRTGMRTPEIRWEEI